MDAITAKFDVHSKSETRDFSDFVVINLPWGVQNTTYSLTDAAFDDQV